MGSVVLAGDIDYASKNMVLASTASDYPSLSVLDSRYICTRTCRFKHRPRLE